MDRSHQFSHFPLIDLGSRQGSHGQIMSERYQPEWNSTSSNGLEALSTTGVRMSMQSWILQKHVDDSCVPRLDNTRNFTNESPPWNAAFPRTDLNSQLQGYNTCDRFSPWPPVFNSPQYITPQVGSRLVSEQSSSPEGSTWSPEPSEDHLEHESGDACSRQIQVADGRCASIQSEPGYCQRYLCHSPSLSQTSSYIHTPSDPGITLQDVQQYPDACPEDYDHRHHSPANEIQDPYILDPSNRWRTLSNTDCISQPVKCPPSPCETPATCGVEADEIKADATSDGENDSGSDYSPSACKTSTYNAKAFRVAQGRKHDNALQKKSCKARSKSGKSPKSSRVSKRPSKGSCRTSGMITSGTGKDLAFSCSQCSATLQTKSALKKHISTAHTRPFTCTFRIYGCTSTFGSKNEWKRHVSSQHLRLGIWRCDIGACMPQQLLSHASPDHTTRKPKRAADETSPEELTYNDFNRKDLFTQHLRRMHAPPPSCSPMEKENFNASLDSASKRCLKNTREPPSYTVCGYCSHDATGRQSVFQGPGSWEARMEHVGRHLESGHGERGSPAWKEDDALRNWMANEGLIERSANGSWRLVGLHSEEDRGKKSRK